MNTKSHIRMMLSGITLAFIAAACSGEKKEAGEGAEQAQPSAAGGTAPAASATGDTIIVEAWTDATGNYFKPNKIEAKQGDVVRWVLKQGVHNIHFLPDSNTIKEGLPPVSEFLQLPGQTYDLVVNLKKGEYYFQCDPHAALGMKGHLEVEDKD